MILKVINPMAELFPVFSVWPKSQRQLSTEDLSKLKPEAILNEETKAKCLSRLKIVKSRDKLDKQRQAAVLVPLCKNNGKLGLLYTLRSNKVTLNRGQVSFPGGMKDKKDKSLEETALRETWEELQISKDYLDVWGTTNLIIRKDVCVLPLLAYIGEIDPKSIKFNKSEVEEAFVHPLEKLCDPDLCRFTHFRNTYVLPTYFGGSHKIWGLTAFITHLIMNALVPDVYKHNLPYMGSIKYKEKNSTPEIKSS